MSRKLVALAALLSLAVLIGSVIAMARRVAAFNRSESRSLWVLQPVGLREFAFAERPVTITDSIDEQGRDIVTVVYGDQTLRIPATIKPKDPRLPGLVRHEDWFQLLRFADRGRHAAPDFEQKLRSGEIQDRLTIVVRRPLVEDPRTLGQGWKRQWVFDFYELNPAGGFNTETWAYPSGRTQDPVKGGQLIEGTWQYSAALTVMPKLRKPNPKFTNDALHAMGWTLPVAAFSGLALLIMALILGAPQRITRDPAT
jgi:hypothetical protein